jgi:hypothetical protein
MERTGNPRTPKNDDPTDGEIARDANAMGSAGISRHTGTGSTGSDVAAGDTSLRDTTDDASTGAATNDSDDLTDAAGPSGARFGGTGTAGSGPGDPSAAATPESGTRRS